jgi:hypothetical protein
MAFDLVKHEADKMRILRLAFEEVQKSAAAHGDGDYKIYMLPEGDLLGWAGGPETHGQVLIADLERDGLIKFLAGDRYSLTDLGIETARRHIYESSTLAKRRKLQAGAKDVLGKMFASTASQAASLAGAFIAGVISRDLFPAIANALKAALGL